METILTTGPLQFTYWLTTQTSIVTSVTGDARNVATVQIYSGSMLMWSGTMMQPAAKKAVIEQDLVLGDCTISAQSYFSLTIPTTMQDGSVLFSGKVSSSSNPPAPFSAYVATWKLNSKG